MEIQYALLREFQALYPQLEVSSIDFMRLESPHLRTRRNARPRRRSGRRPHYATEGQEYLVLVDGARYALEAEMAKLEPRTSANMAVDLEGRLL
jgi:hypothetical protein